MRKSTIDAQPKLCPELCETCRHLATAIAELTVIGATQRDPHVAEKHMCIVYRALRKEAEKICITMMVYHEFPVCLDGSSEDLQRSNSHTPTTLGCTVQDSSSICLQRVQMGLHKKNV